MEKTNGKPTKEQRDHILNFHLKIAIVKNRVQLSYLLECQEPEKGKPCPLPPDVAIFMCKNPPCPGPTGT